MNRILIILLMICLNACQSFPRFNRGKPVERCGIWVEKHSESLYQGKCRCHMYQVTPAGVGRVSESVDKPLEYCNKHISFSPTDWAEFVNWFNAVFIFVDNAQKEFTRQF